MNLAFKTARVINFNRFFSTGPITLLSFFTHFYQWYLQHISLQLVAVQCNVALIRITQVTQIYTEQAAQ